MRSFRVDKLGDGEGLLSFLRRVYVDAPSVKAIKRAIDEKKCRINGALAIIATRKVKLGDVVTIDLVAPVKGPLFVLYEDADMVVYDKPAGVVSDPKSFSTILVHRLDKETSGVLLTARNQAEAKKLEALFAERNVEKVYLAIVSGVPRNAEGVISSRLEKKTVVQGQTIYGSGLHGKEAVTEWKRVASGPRASLILCRPRTGRTHQIRIHMKEMGHPIIGDLQYGGSKILRCSASRFLLHAWRLELQGHRFEAPVPADFREALQELEIPWQPHG